MSSKETHKEKEKGTLKNVNKSMTRSRRANITFPVSRITRMLKAQREGGRVNPAAGVFMAAVLEYLTAEIMDLASEEAKSAGKKTVQPRHILVGIRNDEEFNKFLYSATISEAGSYHNKEYETDLSGPSQVI